MLKKLGLQNFKSFSRLKELELSPITLVYGPNSSGKSTIIQSLMLLKQSLMANDKNGVLISSGDDITLGDYSTFVNNHDVFKKIKFDLEYSSNQNAREHYLETSRNLLFGNNENRKFKIEYSMDKEVVSIDSFSFECGIKVPGLSISRFRSGGYRFNNSTTYKDYIIKRDHLDVTKSSNKDKINSSFSGVLETSSGDNLPVINKDAKVGSFNSYSQKISYDIVSFLDSIRYLGPLRSSPKRFYAQGMDGGKKGKGKNNLGVKLGEQGSEVVDDINKRFREFEIPYELSVENLGNDITGKIVSLGLKDLRSGAKITPADVGFGIGQVLPIILEASISKSKILCVEQPEIHLHPRLQAHLADLFIDSVNPSNGNNQWIIETHSEALLLRLQRRIRTKKIPKEMVSIIYVDVGDEGAQITKIPLNDNGDFTVHWPDGFFEERLQEMMGN